MKQADRLKIAASLGRITSAVSVIDRASKRDERTDLDAVWDTLYAIRREARKALRVILPTQRTSRAKKPSSA